MSGFTMPSATLLAQSILSGVFVGALYGLLGLGLSLSWGLLRLINLAHFAFAFLAAYLCYQMATMGLDPLLSLLIIVPLFFAIGAGLHWAMMKFRITPFNSLLLTFGLTGIVEALIQTIWTADFRKLESSYGEAALQGRRPVRAAARTDHAGAGGGPVLRGVGGAALHRSGQGAARLGRGRADRRGLRHQPAPQCAAAGRHLLGAWPAWPACAWR